MRLSWFVNVIPQRHFLSPSSFSLFETTLIWSGVLSGPSIVCTVSWVGRSNACRASLLKSSCVSFNLSRFSIWICLWSFHSILCSNLFNCVRSPDSGHIIYGRRLCDQLINNCCRFILTHSKSLVDVDCGCYFMVKSFKILWKTGEIFCSTMYRSKTGSWIFTRLHFLLASAETWTKDRVHV